MQTKSDNLFGYIIASTIPIILFIIQYVTILNSNLYTVKNIYLFFLISYSFGVFFAYYKKPYESFKDKPHQLLNLFIPIIVISNFILLIYFLIIFWNYYSANGYEGIRGFLTSEEIKSSPYYVRTLMYINSYILYPLNFILLTYLILFRKNWWLFLLSSILIIEYVFVFSSRMILYQFLMIFLFRSVYERLSFVFILKKYLKYFFLLFIVGTLIVFNRDENYTYFSLDEISRSIKLSIINYHIIQPYIIDNLLNSSEYFKYYRGHQIASFGFIYEPILFLINGPNGLASRILSAESQNTIIHFDTADYNAFATFLYPAFFDFSFYGPIVYGIFFGYVIGKSFVTKSIFGGMTYIFLSWFVYFNSFTFSITGEWLILFIFLFCFIKRVKKYKSN